MAVLFGGGLAVAGFLPPSSPTASATEIATIYQAHAKAIIIGQILMMLAAPFYATFSVAIGMQMARIEGKSPVLAIVEMSMGTMTAVFLMIPTFIFAAAAYRPEQDPNITLVLNDVGWIGFIWTVSAPLVQYGAIAACILRDRSKTPLLPRWLGFYNLLFALAMWGGAFVPLFKTGPFAWNGFLAYWLIVSVFFGWLILMVATLTKAVGREYSPASPSAPY